jgi:hypothetical protein
MSVYSVSKGAWPFRGRCVSHATGAARPGRSAQRGKGFRGQIVGESWASSWVDEFPFMARAKRTRKCMRGEGNHVKVAGAATRLADRRRGEKGERSYADTQQWLGTEGP